MTNERLSAAQDIADGVLTVTAIADKYKVARCTIYEWLRNAEFKAAVAEFKAEYREETRRLGLASRERRIRALNDRWNRCRRVIEDRADDPKMANVPGGRTGLIVEDTKGVGGGEDFELVSVYRVDTALLAELRAIEKQAAQELGQWSEKHEIDLTNATDNDLLTRARTDPVIQRAVGIARGVGAEGPGGSPSEN